MFALIRVACTKRLAAQSVELQRQRGPELSANLAPDHGNGRYAKLKHTLDHVQLLILDDRALKPLNEQVRYDIL